MGKPAARIGDMHQCPLTNPDGSPHVGGPIGPLGSSNVNIGGQAAARQTDLLTCIGPKDIISAGSNTVFINGLAAARQGDATAHGGIITQGFPLVNIG